MANNKEEAGKGTPRPGDMPAAKRPYATLDLTASEVDAGGKAKPSTAPPAQATASAQSGSEAKASAKPAGDGSKPETAPRAATSASPGGSKPAGQPGLLASIPASPFLTHLAAGAAGALLVLLVSHVLAPVRSADPPAVGDLSRRLAEIETALGTRPGAGLRGRIEEMSRSAGALGEAQAKLARETKALDARVAGAPAVAPEIASRLAKLEETLATASTADAGAASPQIVGIVAKITELEKSLRQAGESAQARTGELAALRTEAGRLTQRLDSLKGEVEERMNSAAKTSDFAPLAAKLATIEKDTQAFARNEVQRAASASNMLLSLELAGLKRAIERGEGYAEELARAKRVAGATVNLAPLERGMRDGVPTQRELATSFRSVANAMIDAEAETSEASLLDRLMAGARSIVRVRKVGHAGDDQSLEAIIGRMETALKEGRTADVLAQGKKLPPKAALAGEDWLRKVEARQSVDEALAGIEASLKASLGAPPAVPDAKR